MVGRTEDEGKIEVNVFYNPAVTRVVNSKTAVPLNHKEQFETLLKAGMFNFHGDLRSGLNKALKFL